MPLCAKERAIEVVQNQWANDLITSWNKHAWIELPISVGHKIARLIGAAPHTVIACDSISVNLFKLLSVAITKQNGRNIVLSQTDNFPTDLYMVEGMQTMLGSEKIKLQHCDEDQIESVLEAQGEDIAVLMLTHVNFRSGAIHDMRALTKKAHQKGVLVIWDLAHSAGVLPLHLDEDNVDFAVGCGYKYLNGGPGAPAFVYVNQKYLSDLKQPLAGWMGHASPFDFSPQYKGADNIKQMLCGTPSVISMSVLDAALDVFTELSIDDIRSKSLAMTEYVRELIADQSALYDLVLSSPKDADKRGSQLAYAHPNAYEICQALIKQGVIADFRAPNILRLGFSPLFLSFESCLNAIVILCDIMSKQTYLSAEFAQRNAVT
jgi:kynureninase